ncbi:MAG: hypothetical protein ACYCVP_04640 [Thermoplasmataceae archaeon]
MGKFSAYIIGLFTAITLSYYVLSSFYSPLINWVGPIFGAPLIFIVSILFLLLGDVFNHLILIPLLIVIGVIIGVAAMKGTRAIGAAIAVYFSLWGFIASSALSLYIESKSKFTNLTNTIGSGSISSSLPAPPSGSTIGTIMAEPLFSRALTTIEKVASTGFNPASSGGRGAVGFSSVGGNTYQGFLSIGGVNLGGIINNVLMVFLPYLIINLAIMLIAAGLTGRFVYRRTNKGAIPKKPKKEKRTKDVIIFILIILVMASFVGVYTPHHTLGNQNSSTGYIGNPAYNSFTQYNKAMSPVLSASNMVTSLGREGALSPNLAQANATNQDILSAGVIGTHGSSYNAFLNMAAYNGHSNSNWIYSSGQSSSIVSLVAQTDNLPQLFRSVANGLGVGYQYNSSGLAGSAFWNLMPQSVIIMAYNGTLANTSGAAGVEINNIMSQLGGSNGAFIVELSLKTPFLGVSDSNVTLYVYTFTSDYYSSENAMINDLSTSISYSGSNKIFVSGVKSGYLVPGYLSTSVDSSIFVAGFVHSGIFSAQLMKYIGLNSTLNSNRSLVFDGGLFAKSDIITSSSTIHDITGAQIYGYNGNISFSDNQVNYGILLGVPEGNNSGNFTIYTNYIGFPSQFKGIINVSNTPNGTFSMNAISMQSNHLYPANIHIKTVISTDGGHKYTVSTSVINNDTSTLTSVSINETSFYSQYAGSVNITSGSLMANDSTLNPGQTFTNSFSFTASNPGTYSVSQPAVQYNMNGTTFSKYGASAQVSGPTPFVTTGINEVWYNSAKMLGSTIGNNIFTDKIFNGFYFFDLILLLIILADIALEIRAYKRWKKWKNAMWKESSTQTNSPKA